MDREGIARRDHDGQAVPDEHPGIHRVRDAGHRLLVGGREHVRLRPLFDLPGQVGTRAEDEGHLDIRVLRHERVPELGERLRQRGGGEHTQIPRCGGPFILAARRRCGQQGCQRQHRQRPQDPSPPAGPSGVHATGSALQAPPLNVHRRTVHRSAHPCTRPLDAIQTGPSVKPARSHSASQEQKRALYELKDNGSPCAGARDRRSDASPRPARARPQPARARRQAAWIQAPAEAAIVKGASPVLSS